jgi:hypothetical protein
LGRPAGVWVCWGHARPKSAAVPAVGPSAWVCSANLGAGVVELKPREHTCTCERIQAGRHILMAPPTVKTLLVAIALLGVVACGDATTTPLASIPSAIATTPSPAVKSPVAKSPAPTKSPAPPAKTVVAFLNAPLTVARNHYATLKAKTAARISCSIDVEYASGSSTAAGLVAKTSDSTGQVSWTWKVGGRTTIGTWPITVTCGSGSAQTSIKVT